MGARHNYEQRRSLAQSVPTLGVAAVAEKARVTIGTVRDWCREFQVSLSSSTMASAAWPEADLGEFGASLSAEEDLHETAENVRDVAHRALADHSEWDRRAAFRRHYTNFARHNEASREAPHDAMDFFHARHMRTSVLAMAACAPEPDVRDVLQLSEEAIFGHLEDMEHAVYFTDDDLPVPAYDPLPSPVRYADFSAYHEDLDDHPYPLAELDGLARFFAQEHIAAGESEEWRTHRDEFLRYCDVRTDDTHHEAMELHWTRRMQQAFERMTSSARGPGHESYKLGAALLEELRSGDESESDDFDWEGFDDFDDGLDQYFADDDDDPIPCPDCDGKGWRSSRVEGDFEECGACLGTREVELSHGEVVECPSCDGEGWRALDDGESSVRCDTCEGTGDKPSA